MHHVCAPVLVLNAPCCRRVILHTVALSFSPNKSFAPPMRNIACIECGALDILSVHAGRGEGQ